MPYGRKARDQMPWELLFKPLLDIKAIKTNERTRQSQESSFLGPWMVPERILSALRCVVSGGRHERNSKAAEIAAAPSPKRKSLNAKGQASPAKRTKVS